MSDRACNISSILSADEPALENITKRRVIESMALRIIVKYVRNAIILPGAVSPAFTRTAPTNIIITQPTLRRKFITGLVSAIVIPAFFSFSTTSRLIFSNLSRS